MVLSEFGETPLDAVEKFLSLQPMEPPEVSKLSAREVVISVKSASVGWVDLLMSSGQYQHLLRPPYTPGLEYAGVVAWAGPEATGFPVGTQVLVDLLAGPPARRLPTWVGRVGWRRGGLAIPEPPDQACNQNTDRLACWPGWRLKAGES